MLEHYITKHGIQIELKEQQLNYHNAINPLIERLNENRGALFTSSFEYPGRYTCWDIGFSNPPLAITTRGRKVSLEALNKRGEVLLSMLTPVLSEANFIEKVIIDERLLNLEIKQVESVFAEETRSQQPSVFSVIRQLIDCFYSKEDTYLGLYGSFGYDLIFQFEHLEQKHQRSDSKREMVCYLPDEIYIVNHRKEEAFIRRYDFLWKGKSTQGLAREGSYIPFREGAVAEKSCDHQPGEYAKIVEVAKKKFECGDLFEVVPSQTFFSACKQKPSEIFKKIQKTNPSPYGFFINLGESEYLVGASPEMYVRVKGNRVETCPISGTIKRGANAIEDAKNIQQLLDSEKEESELTMCTDVDRNDKSRICQAGSVKVIGRRQIEMYSRLIHTVDHVEGYLRDEFDAVDAFLTHMWVVTVTGAPKLWAMNFIEQHEKSPRGWYAGSVGWFHFNGNLNTGLVLRTIQIKQGIASVRVGATLLYDSNPESEEQETQLKASAFLDILNEKSKEIVSDYIPIQHGANKRVLLIDHQDSFVHTLANYFRQTGADVMTVRYDAALEFIDNKRFDLIVLSPGPGSPSDFNLNATIAKAQQQKIALFGVCLGLQGIVEYFGGTLDQLTTPVHGKSSHIKINGGSLFSDIDNQIEVGRYHSLYAKDIPKEIQVTAITKDAIVMAIEHETQPITAVQFHPETILSMQDNVGLKLIENVMKML
jgi:anthranilate synthase